MEYKYELLKEVASELQSLIKENEYLTTENEDLREQVSENIKYMQKGIDNTGRVFSQILTSVMNKADEENK